MSAASPTEFHAAGYSQGRYNAATVLLGHLSREEISRREEQDRTEERNQNPACVSLGYHRYALVPITLVVVASSLVSAIIILIIIVVRVCQSGKSYCGG